MNNPAIVLPSCMGGRCPSRETCAHYHRRETVEPLERLCRVSHPGEFFRSVLIAAPVPIQTQHLQHHEE